MKRAILMIILIALAILGTIGCSEKKLQEPAINVMKEIQKNETIQENKTVQEEINISAAIIDDFRTVEIIATETSFIPSQINFTYGEKARLVVKSNYTHNLYAPALQINKQLNIGETEIYIPTDRIGSYTFWCNMLHYGSQHARMKGKITVE
jgi:plastocyanin